MSIGKVLVLKQSMNFCVYSNLSEAMVGSNQRDNLFLQDEEFKVVHSFIDICEWLTLHNERSKTYINVPIFIMSGCFYNKAELNFNNNLRDILK